MALAIIAPLIRALLDANWSDTPVIFDNEGAEAPRGPAGEPVSFVLAKFSGTASIQSSIGAGTAAENYWQDQGVVWFHIHTPTGTGVTSAYALLDALMTMFRGLQLTSTIALEDMEYDDGARADDFGGNYWRITLSIDWVQRYG